MKLYESRILNFSNQFKKIKLKYSIMSALRLICILFSLVLGYYYFQKSAIVYLISALVFLVAFFILMKLHSKLQFQLQFYEALIFVNTTEINYLEKNEIPFENGVEFIDFQHAYAYDLDIFGNCSLFQNINRTATFIGKKTLANRFSTLLSSDEIIRNQEAIKELSQKLDFRHEFYALAKIGHDTKSGYETLLKWNQFNSKPLSKWSVCVSIISPLFFLVFSLSYWLTSKIFFLNLLTLFFVVNLAFLGIFLKRIQLEIANSANIDKLISHYGFLLHKIENEDFKCDKLIALQEKLVFKNEKASTHLKDLAALLSSMDTIQNFVTAILFNGSFLYNLHRFNALIKWKNRHSKSLENWLEVIGEFELLSSLANLSFNNPDFVFPDLNTNYKISFSNLSHPLLSKKTRIGNNVDFQQQPFIILTGSNMSGKSTFLRSLGVNMVLTGVGSAVCASSANVHPLPVLVSMRLSDSLSDSESYFFAEIKRLQLIMTELNHQPAFVLLDEILRGTNSDDKRNGTIEVIKKVIGKKAIGAIATHDKEVCLTTNDYADLLTNKCFEVEIVNDNLHFDFLLRDGICKNKSATFLMKRAGVI